MANSSFKIHTGDGSTTQFSVPFEFIKRAHVKVYLDDAATAAWSWVNDGLIDFDSAPGNGVEIKIQRETPETALHDFQTGGVISEKKLDDMSRQGLYRATEFEEQVGHSVDDAEGFANAAANSEANAEANANAAANSASAAQTAETNAESAETGAINAKDLAEGFSNSAANSAADAEDSANAAANSEANAAVSESNAANSESNAAASASDASNAAAEAASKYDSFDDRYLGEFASDPSTDNDGNTLQAGALYWNTTNNEMRTWSGSAWKTAYNAGGVTAWNSRTGSVTPEAGDYDASQVNNDSNVAGSTVAEALDNTDVWSASGGDVSRSSGNVGIGTATPSKRLDVSGSIAVSGTVDGRDLATDGAKLDNIEANADVTDLEQATGRSLKVQPNVTPESGTLTLDHSLGEVIQANVNGNVTSWNLTNQPNGASFFLVRMELDATGGHTIDFPNGWNWEGSTEPSPNTAAGAVHTLSIIDFGNGTIDAALLEDVG